MEQTHFTPLRLGVLIMLGILIAGSLLFRFWPGRYAEPSGQSLENIVKVTTLTPDAFLKLTKEANRKLVIVDIRSEEAYTAGHLEGAIHMLPGELTGRKAIRKLRKKEVLVYGDLGTESAAVAELLRMTGISAMAADRGYGALISVNKGDAAKQPAEAQAFPFRSYFKALESSPAPVVEVKVPVPKAGGC